MFGNSQGSAGLGLIAAYNDQNQGGEGSSSVNYNANIDIKEPSDVSIESIKKEPMSPEQEPEVFDWGNLPVAEGPAPGGYQFSQQLFMMQPPHTPIPIPEPVPSLQEDLIKQNEYVTNQLLEEREAKENLTDEVEKLKKVIGKKDVELQKKDEALRKKNDELLETKSDLKECQNEKASLKKKLKSAELDYYDEKKTRKKLREDFDNLREELDEEVQRRKDMEDNLATVAFSLQKLQSSVRCAVGAGASMSNDVNDLCRQLEERLSDLSVSYNVVERNYLKSREELHGYQRMYGDRSQQLQHRDPRLQAQALPPPHHPVSREPLLPSNSSSSSMPSSALIPRRPPLPPPTQYVPPPPPPPPEELDLEYDPRKKAVVPNKRPSDSSSNAVGPRPSTSGGAAAKPMPPQSQNSQNFAEPSRAFPVASVRPGVNENGQNFFKRRNETQTASGSGLGHHHGQGTERSTTPISSSSTSSSSMSNDEPRPGPAPKLVGPKKKIAKVEKNSDSEDEVEKQHGWRNCKSSDYFLCLCGERFRDREEFFSHIQKRSTEKKFACDLCDTRFSEKANLQSHMLHTHSVDKLLVELGPFKCHDCGGEFEDRADLFSHLKLVHKKGPHAPKVKQEFEAARPRKRTAAPAHAPTGIIFTLNKPKVPRFACKCGKNFASKVSLNAHIKGFSKGNIFKCEWCPKSFKTHSGLKGHLEKDHKIERDKRSCGCRDCGRVFSSYERLMKHRNKRHNKKE